MPMPQLSTISDLERRQKLRETKECHKCNGQSRYIHNWKVWCKNCLDFEQYPQLASMSVEERQELRQKALKIDTKVSFVNTGNLGKIGF